MALADPPLNFQRISYLSKRRKHAQICEAPTLSHAALPAAAAIGSPTLRQRLQQEPVWREAPPERARSNSSISRWMQVGKEHPLQRASLAKSISCKEHLLQRASLAKSISCKEHPLQRASLAKSISCKEHLLSRAAEDATAPNAFLPFASPWA